MPSATDNRSPDLSVVVCSIGSGTPEETVDSILASAQAADAVVEVVVVWQGAGPPPPFPEGTEVLDVFPVGLSHARNRGLEATRASVVAFVDDDEVVDPAWATGVLAAFRRDPRPDAAFGPVAPRDERGLPYCHYEGGEHRVFEKRSTPPWIVGTGGNMAFARDVLLGAGGFDLRFGVGAVGHSAEESDLIVRLLRAGHTLAWSPDMPVYHPTKGEHAHLESRYPYGRGMGTVARRHLALMLGARYLRAIFQVLSGALWRREARRRREGLATLRGFLAGVAFRATPISPARALDRLPEELRQRVDRARLKPLPMRLGAAPELRYRVGRGLLLHVFVQPAPRLETRIAESGRVLDTAAARDSLWVLAERPRRGLRRAPPDLAVPVPGVDEGPEGVDAAAATTGASVLSGGAWQTASGVVPQVYALVQSVVAARFLGPEGMGLQSFIAFTALSVTALLSLGFSIALMRYIGETLGRRRPAELRDLVRWGWAVEAVAALLGGGALAAAGFAGANPRAAWLLVAFASAVGILHTIPTAVLSGAQRWREASVVGLVTGAVATAATTIVLAAGGGITGMFAVEAIVAVVNMSWTTALARRTLGEVAPISTGARGRRSDVTRYALLMSYSSILTFIVWRRSELFFLQRYSTNTQIALYSIAFSAMTALAAIPQAVGSVVSPAVATLFGAGASERLRNGFSRGLRLLLFASLPLTAGALAVGPEMLRLVYGHEYRGSGAVLLLLLAPFPLIPLVHLARAFLSGVGRLHFQLAVGTAGAAFNVALDVLLIPRHGAIGAAIANALSQLIAGLPVFIYACYVVGRIRWEPSALARTAVAAAGTCLAAWIPVYFLADVEGLLLGVGAGTLVFGLLAAVLRILPADDAAWLDDVVGARFGGLLGRTVRQWASQPAPSRG